MPIHHKSFFFTSIPYTCCSIRQFLLHIMLHKVVLDPLFIRSSSYSVPSLHTYTRLPSSPLATQPLSLSLLCYRSLSPHLHTTPFLSYSYPNLFSPFTLLPFPLSIPTHNPFPLLPLPNLILSLYFFLTSCLSKW